MSERQNDHDSERAIGPIPPPEFLEPPGHQALPRFGQHEDGHRNVGQHWGKFEIRSVIGRGSSGVVFEAWQEHPGRRVALKTLRQPIWSDSAIRRFDYESRVLGRLSHPNIAHVFETNSTNNPPYFAMELIEGIPLTIFAQQEELDPRGKIKLLIDVCRAVEHAHQRGVVHRDLKPSNILVTTTGQPKILDFGIARVTDSDIESVTRQTQLGDLVGTIPYMSPEQCSGDPDGLDTRSDVYALGVIGYELLVGQPPYELPRFNIPASLRTIQETPPKSPALVRRELGGDLSVILLKALEKDKEQRYPSAAAFADDLTRYVRNEPILARPQSARYQIRKFAARHKALTLTSAVFVTVLMATTAIAITMWRNAAYQAGVAQDTSRLIQSMLTTAYASERERETYTVRQLLDDFVERLDNDQSIEPEVEAEVRKSLAEGYEVLGRRQQTLDQCEKAVFLFRKAYGDGDVRTAKQRLTCVWHWGGIDFESAVQRVKQCADDFAEHFGEDHWTFAMALSIRSPADLNQGDPVTAISLAERAVAILLESDDVPMDQLAQGMAVLAFIYEKLERFEDAITYLRMVIGLTPQSALDRRRVAVSRRALGRILVKLNRPEEAEEELRLAIDTFLTDVPIYIGAAASTRVYLGQALVQQGRFEEARELLLEAKEYYSTFEGDHYAIESLEQFDRLADEALAGIEDQPR